MNEAQLTIKDVIILEEFNLRDSQHRNLLRVISTCPPKKAEKLEKEVLPKYIQRRFNALQKAQKAMKKHGLVFRHA